MMWPWMPRTRRPDGEPWKGLNYEGIKLDAPPDDAPAQQWLDWSAIVGHTTAWPSIPQPRWLRRAYQAYQERWGG